MTSLFSTIIPLQLTDVKANLTYTDGLIFSLWITWLYPVSTATVQVFTLGFFLLLLFPSFSNRKQTRCIWFTSGGSRRGRVLPAPPQNVLRGVEGGAAVGVIYFVNIFRPRGPHSHPPWPVSRPRLSARESITSSGYGPFKVFPQLWLSFSCSSGAGGEATPSCLATQLPWPPGLRGPGPLVPHRAGAPQGLSPSLSPRLGAPAEPQSHPPEPAGIQWSWGQLLPAWATQDLQCSWAIVLISVTPAFSAPSQNPWASTWGWDFSPKPRPLAWGVTCRELFLLSALPFFLSSLRRADIWLRHHERTRYLITWLCQIA